MARTADLAVDSPDTTAADVGDGDVTLSLARRADRFPDRTAIVDISEEELYAPARTIDERRVSYAALSELATATAERLATLEVGSGDTVCLLTRNRVASLVLFFACRRLGATLAPISHLLTPVTVQRPFEHIAPALVVSEAAQRDLVRSIPVDQSLTLEELAAVDPADDVELETGPVTSDGPRLVCHGERGRPLVAYGERTLEHNCLTAVVAWGLGRGDVVPLIGPLSSFHSLLRGGLPALYVGGRLLLDRAFDPGDALTAIATHGATFVAGRPMAYRDLAADPGADALASLERAVVEGPMPEDVAAAFFERGVSVMRAYGRLECPTAFSRAVDVGPDTVAVSDHDCVGRPVPDCRARLVADGTVLEGAGEGRLELAGPVVADGYVDDVDGDLDEDGRSESDTRANEQSNGTANRGQFRGEWFDSRTRFRRDDDDVYHAR